MASQKPKILLFGQLDHASSFWKSHIDPLATTVDCSAKDRAEFLSQCKSGTYDGCIAGYRTFPSVSQTGIWDDDLCAALPKSFRFIAHNGAGYDQLTPSSMSKHGIVACNVPTAVDDATADTAIFLLLGALRNFPISQYALRQKQWRGNPPPPLGHDPQGKVLGILGMGGIGRNFATKARAFGMKIAYHNRRKLSDSDADGATYMSFDELLAKSDVLSINVPLSPATRHLIGAKELAKCKEGVVVVNTARGAVIDEAALVHALESGHVASAGLDVYEEEPKVHEGLVKNERCCLLPHMGTWTKETQTKMEEWAITNVELAVKGLGDASQRKGWEKMSVIGEHKETLQEWSDKGAPEKWAV